MKGKSGGRENAELRVTLSQNRTDLFDSPHLMRCRDGIIARFHTLKGKPKKLKCLTHFKLHQKHD